MSRRNRPPAARPAAPQTAGSAHDGRSTEEIMASVRRKLVFGALALSAPLIALGLSLAADQSRRAAFQAHLPEGITLATPLAVPTASAANVGDRLAELGAELLDDRIVDGAGKAVVFQTPEAPPPPEADTVQVVEIQGGAAR